MLLASDAFHEAVYSPSPSTRMLIRCGDTIFTNEDIHITAGVKIMEPMNLNEELTIGTAPAATLDTTIMNYNGLLSDFQFGECEVTLGVRTKIDKTDAYPGRVKTTLRFGGQSPVTFVGNKIEPYLLTESEPANIQPPFPVYAMLSWDNMLYCIGENGEYWVAAWVDGTTWEQNGTNSWNVMSGKLWNDIQGKLVAPESIGIWDVLAEYTWDDVKTSTWNSWLRLPEINDFMTNKFKNWAKAGRGISFHNDIMGEFYSNGNSETYEFVKLGMFSIKEPEKQKINLIKISARDRMSHFDVIADDFLNSLSYPITLGAIFQHLCDYVGVPRATQTFLNSTRSFAEPPLQTQDVTAREILGWIAEASCSTARMTRDGEVELAWFAEPIDTPTLAMNQYYTIDAAEYAVSQIDKLQIQGTEDDIGVIIGSGINGYIIQDCPFLYGASDNEIRTYGVPIYNRLASFESFAPIVCKAVCDWSIRAGDIIKLDIRGTEYKLPIYSQVITWSGGASAKVVYESTGAESRPPVSATNRRLYQQKRAMNEITVTVDGMTSRLTNIEGDVANLSFTIGSFDVNFVRKDGVVSAINLTPEQAKIIAERISLEGLVTVNNRFRILLDGSMEAVNGKFSGTIEADSGRIGQFNIQSGVLSGPQLLLDPLNGRIQLGNLSMYETASSGTVFSSPDTIAFFTGNTATMIVGTQGIEARSILQARYGLFLNPSKVTDKPANMYMDPATGEVFRTTNTSGGGGGGTTPDPDPEPIYTLQAYGSVVPSNPTTSTGIYFNFGASGGVQPYTQFMLRYLFNGQWIDLYSGPDQTFGPYRIVQSGSHTATVTAWDSQGTSATTTLRFTVS